jgi:hypothetical protein
LGVLEQSVLDDASPPQPKELHSFVDIGPSARQRCSYDEVGRDHRVPWWPADEDVTRLDLVAGKDSMSTFEPSSSLIATQDAGKRVFTRERKDALSAANIRSTAS